MTMPLCEPEILTVRAGILARTPAEHMFRIGVIGQDEEDARKQFGAALVRWGKLADLIEERRQADTVKA